MSTTSRVEPFVSFAVLAFYRTVIGTPLEGIAKREILNTGTSRQVLQATPFREFWRGFQPNGLKIVTRTYVQVGSYNFASRVVPVEIEPKRRGVLIGATSSLLEVTVQNIWNVLMVRFIQGQGWNVIKNEGLSIFHRGLSPAVMHRLSSAAVFWGAYENLKQLYPHHTAMSGTIAGLTQVALTSPFYILTALKQSKNPPPESLPLLTLKIGRTQGWIRGLLLRGLIPRSIHSMATSAVLMTLLEKYQIIRR